jgi:hypothetical protein
MTSATAAIKSVIFRKYTYHFRQQHLSVPIDARQQEVFNLSGCKVPRMTRDGLDVHVGCNAGLFLVSHW